MDEAKTKDMTDEWIVLNAIGRAQDVLAAYVHPGGIDEKRALSELLVILDDRNLVEAHERMTWRTTTRSAAENERRRDLYYEAQRNLVTNEEDPANGK
jgi:hypothetical protein